MDNLYDFFGMKEDPFRLTPDPMFFYPSVIHKEALFSLDYVVKEREGFCLVTGEPGTGKTTLTNVVKERWKNRAEIALILTPRLSPDEFLATLLEDLNVSFRSRNKNELLKAFRDFLIEKYLSGIYVIIIVDEAQNVPDETLEELRLLSNLETEKEKLLQIVLIGQPELETRLKKDRLRQLDQRIIERVRLRPLRRAETVEYVNYRLAKAGREYMKVSPRLVAPLYRFSRGIPRLINLVASRTIMSAYIEGCTTIQKRHVTYAVNYFQDKSKRRKLAGVFGGGAVGAACLALMMYFMAFEHDPVEVALLSATEVKYPVPEAATSPEPAAVSAVEKHAPDHGAVGKDNAAGTGNMTAETPGEELRAVVAVSAANVRALPELDAARIGLLYNGRTIDILEETSDNAGDHWYRLHDYAFGDGWVSGQVVRLVGGDESAVSGAAAESSADLQETRHFAEKKDNVKLPMQYAVQFGSYRNLPIAEREAALLHDRGYEAYIEKIHLVDTGTWYRLKVGHYTAYSDAVEVKQQLAQNFQRKMAVLRQ